MSESNIYTENDLDFTDYSAIKSYRNEALLKVLLNKGIVTKEEINACIDEQALKRLEQPGVEEDAVNKIKYFAHLK